MPPKIAERSAVELKAGVMSYTAQDAESRSDARSSTDTGEAESIVVARFSGAPASASNATRAAIVAGAEVRQELVCSFDK